MKVGVVGLGLIGGSMAKAVKKKTDHEVIGWDVSETIRYSALLMEAVHGFMDNGNPKDCDIVIIGLYPQLTVDYIKEHAKDFKKGAIVVIFPLLFISSIFLSKLANTLFQFTSKNKLFYLCISYVIFLL